MDVSCTIKPMFGYRKFILLAAVMVAVLVAACDGGIEVPEAPTLTPTTVTAEPSPTSPPTAPEVTSTASTPLGQSSYVVEGGDTPSFIAEKLGVPPEDRGAWVMELLAINGVQAEFIQVGQELILPPY